MSREMHLLNSSNEYLCTHDRGRLWAAAILFVSFSAFVAFAPEDAAGEGAAALAAVNAGIQSIGNEP